VRSRRPGPGTSVQSCGHRQRGPGIRLKAVEFVRAVCPSARRETDVGVEPGRGARIFVEGTGKEVRGDLLRSTLSEPKVVNVPIQEKTAQGLGLTRYPPRSLHSQPVPPPLGIHRPRRRDMVLIAISISGATAVGVVEHGLPPEARHWLREQPARSVYLRNGKRTQRVPGLVTIISSKTPEHSS